MYDTTSLRKGLKIEIEGKPYEVVDFQHVKPGKGGAFVRTKLRNILTGGVVDQTFRSGEKFDKPDLEDRAMQFLYREGDNYYFMDNETYDQIFLTSKQMGDSRAFLAENTVIKVQFYNEKPIGVELPMFVELTIAESDPGVKGDTASKVTKQAKLETGATLPVPLFINAGDIIKVDTREGSYVERVKNK